jgi:nucleoid DNA-binding protein|nr:MAG TPA: Bacterial DNA-binding protein [Caudoviricetes sp.]
MWRVTKQGLIRFTAEKTGMTIKDTEKVVDQFIDTIIYSLGRGYEVYIPRFVKLTPHKVGERTYHMPGGGTVISPARTRIGVRFSKTLKAKINK